ncbi:MAG TPA: alpha-ketoglutarate-dependent dioxygenase AlkB [Porticoccaceae bacterium]|nr:alpha-ketoglutarate-dependent dioxygenase AlkB [Porticoccaceae bacterium]HIK80069.1 alpha-ketoglutarate-dependent dioxygenase AlkB [Porticoccaceae bacterium]
MDLFEQQVIPLQLSSDRQSEITFWPSWLGLTEADDLLATAIDQIAWRHDNINIAGKSIPIPRLQNWYGDPTTSYSYSRIRLQAVAFPPWMEILRRRVERQTGNCFNRTLVNYYRDGRDSVDWHADDEIELGSEPIIASVSLGQERAFLLRHKTTKERLKINLPHGSLMMMGSGIQEYWHHSIAKDKNVVESRINFTFRNMD